MLKRMYIGIWVTADLPSKLMSEILLPLLLVCFCGVVAWYVHKWATADETGNRRFYVTVTCGLCMLSLFIGAEKILSREGILMMLLFSAMIFIQYRKMLRQRVA
jgi:hypothetical protein